MDQNLVDHDLEEKRRHKREQLEEKGGDEHLAEKVPIFVDRAQEPSEIETLAQVAQSRPSSHQDQAAVPMTMNVPSLSDAIAGNGVLVRRDQSVRTLRAFRPSSLAHRRISGAPIVWFPIRWMS